MPVPRLKKAGGGTAHSFRLLSCVANSNIMGGMRKKQITFALLVIAVFAALAYIAYPYLAPGPTNLGPFASCLKDKGVIFYGAFWCPHCRAQKALFGNAVELLPYNECSNPDASEMQSCKDAGVGSSPTVRGSRENNRFKRSRKSRGARCLHQPFNNRVLSLWLKS